MNDTPEKEGTTYRVSLSIPCLAEYVSIARLAILGIAGRMPFSYDEVEDVRLAVGEACTHAVERAAARWTDPDTAARAAATADSVGRIDIECSVATNALTIDVCDNIAPSGSAQARQEDAEAFEEAGIDRQHLSALLMEILVDEVQVKSRPDGTCVRLVKYASQS